MRDNFDIYIYSVARLVSYKLNELNTSNLHTFGSYRLYLSKAIHCKIGSNKICVFFFKNQNH